MQNSRKGSEYMKKTCTSLVHIILNYMYIPIMATQRKGLLISFCLGIFIGAELFYTLADKNWLQTFKQSAVANLLVSQSPKGRDKDRILCWVSTMPQNHEKAETVKLTWGKRCDKLIFMSSKEDLKLGAVAILSSESESRDALWNKTRAAFKYVWDNHRDNYDWFLKADDDTFVVIENLRRMLSAHSTNSSIFFGSRIKNDNLPKGYMSGGAGYVLSKGALQRFTQVALPSDTLCPPSEMSEDIAIARCLKNVNVSFHDTRDLKGRHRFLPLNPEDSLAPVNNSSGVLWWEGYGYFPIVKGLKCCSESAITFHYVNSRQMYVLEYLIYVLKLGNNATDEHRTTLVSNKKATRK